MSTGIGADTNLYTPSDLKRVQRTLGVFYQYTRKNKPAAPWLDVGAGESYMREQLIKKTGLDLQTSDIDLDIEPYPFENGTFKTITSFEVLEHLFNPLFHLFELKRVLTDDGNLYLTTPNDYSLIYKVEHALSRKYRPHFHQFSERDLEDIFKRAGFNVISIRKFFRSASGTIARISRNGFFVHAVK